MGKQYLKNNYLIQKEMIKKKILVADIINFLDNKVLSVVGNVSDLYIDNIADVERVSETTLDWINPTKKNKQDIAEKSKAKVLLVDGSIVPPQGKVLIIVKNPKVALAEVGNRFFVEKPQPYIHPTAIIDEKAEIGNDCYIGPYSVIGEAKVGDGCVIDANVRIYDNVVLGDHCSIKAGAVLGGLGFGFERDEKGNRFRFPQIGGLIIGDYVEVGSNTCVDGGALSETIIGDYTKINNLCHVAHNNKIGKNVCVAACVNLSGGNIVEDNVWIAPNASLRGYIHVGEKAFIGTGAVVVKDVPSNETWIGNPAHKLEKK